MPEWPHKIDADGIGTTPVRTSISASPQERKDIARRLKVETVDSLEATLVLSRASKKHLLHVEGTLRARLAQSCIVTLEPVVQEIEAPVEGWFANPDQVVSLARARQERDIRTAGAEVKVLDEKDDPEPVVDGQIDLGELVTQHLALAVDPYPRKDGVLPGEGGDAVVVEDKRRESPFAALKKWKSDRNRAE